MTDQEVSIVRIGRARFLSEYWKYEDGEHVCIVGSTGAGKTYLGLQLLGASVSKDRPGVILVMKPRDSTITTWTARLKFKRIVRWPPPTVRRIVDKPRGWVLWPRLGNLETDDLVLAREFSRCLRESYAQAARDRGEPRAIFADEVVGLSKELGLERLLKGLWARGRSVGVGMWGVTQRPFEAPQIMYQSAEHMFLAREPDARNRQRLGEISGFDGQLIQSIVHPEAGVLREHEFLYLGRSNHVMAIIAAR